MRHIESKIQIACVNWFRLKYPHLKKNLIAIPNGGARNNITGAILKAEGVIAGCSDLFLFVPSRDYHGLAIEMKTPSGRQRESQKQWQEAIENQGYRYIVCRSVDEFINEIDSYLKS
jgi:hypothetical protein